VTLTNWYFFFVFSIHYYFDFLTSVIGEKKDISNDLIRYFCTELSSLPSEVELSSKLLTPFETKVPIDDYFYKEWKKWAGNKLDDYFVNSDVLGLTGTRLSSKC